ncbi:ATP-binding protein [Streptomyces nanshensis]|uniref:ATP-binding protein n=1 Tax=Streptomyces nanshensis TaxID=518642 RepID=UPI00085BFF1A|nr:ATP-binding protein [Streptomyces nanshensis]
MTSPAPDPAASPDSTPRRFAMRFTSTPRGANLARRLVAKRLEQWGCSPGTEAHQSMVHIAGELAANAVRHGHVPGRDFRLCLTAATHPAAATAPFAATTTLRIEVTDTRGELRPKVRSTAHAAENGRGLLIVSQLAHRWAVLAHPPTHPGKTVWAEVDAQPVPDHDSSGPSSDESAEDRSGLTEQVSS